MRYTLREAKGRKSNRGKANAAIKRAGCDARIGISEREQVRPKGQQHRMILRPFFKETYETDKGDMT